MKSDTTIHAGDFTLRKDLNFINSIINQLNGNHIFLKGSHDYWIPTSKSIQILEKKIGDDYVVVCHYAMRTWPRSHHNSYHLYGHSHGNLESFGKSYDVGVDNNNYFPVSWDQIIAIMKDKPDNFNLIKPRY